MLIQYYSCNKLCYQKEKLAMVCLKYETFSYKQNFGNNRKILKRHTNDNDEAVEKSSNEWFSVISDRCTVKSKEKAHSLISLLNLIDADNTQLNRKKKKVKYFGSK